MIRKFGNYDRGIYYGKRIYADNIMQPNPTVNPVPEVAEYSLIENWILRNLISYGNCLVEKRYYDMHKKEFDTLFGNENITYRLSSPVSFRDSLKAKHCGNLIEKTAKIILEVNEKALRQYRELN